MDLKPSYRYYIVEDGTIRLENGWVRKISQFREYHAIKKKVCSGNIEPFIMIPKGGVLDSLFGLRKKIAVENTYKINGDSIGSGYGSWHSVFYTPKELCEAIKAHWGQLSPGAYALMSIFPCAEYLAGKNIAFSKEAIDFDGENIVVKPHVKICYGEDGKTVFSKKSMEYAVKVFDCDEEMDCWIERYLKNG